MSTRQTKRKSVTDKHAMTSSEAMIDMHGIVKKFKNAAGEFTVLKGVDLTINRGEFVSIVGKSGSGKSTLLNMITGIDHPTEDVWSSAVRIFIPMSPRVNARSGVDAI